MRPVLTLPKAHLHLHLEGSARPSTVVELAQRSGVDHASFRLFTNLTEFVPCYRAVMGTITELDDVVRISRELIEDEAAQGVTYSQIMVAPQLYGGRLGSTDEVFAAMVKGFGEGVANAAAQGRDIEWQVNVNADRTRGAEWAEDVATWAAANADSGHVRAWGIASDELHGPPLTFVRAASIAKEAGLLVVPHAGETVGPESVRGALDHMLADRISHGVRSVEDPDLVARLVAEGIPLDVCPTSNHRLAVVAAFEDHQLPELLDAGVRVTLNADDQLFFESLIAEEYEKARMVFGLSDSELADIARTSAEVSGAPPATVARMLTGIDAWLAEPPPQP